MSLQEKLGVLSWLNAEILELVNEEFVAEEIEQAGSSREEVYAVMVKRDWHSIWSSPLVTRLICRAFLDSTWLSQSWKQSEVT